MPLNTVLFLNIVRLGNENAVSPVNNIPCVKQANWSSTDCLCEAKCKVMLIGGFHSLWKVWGCEMTAAGSWQSGIDPVVTSVGLNRNAVKEYFATVENFEID